MVTGWCKYTGRLEDLLEAKAEVRRSRARPAAYRVMLGDQSQVEVL